VLHPLIEKYNDNVLEDALKDAIRASRYAYDMIVSTVESKLMKDGADKFTARKQARGAARGMLGNALCTSMVWTANIRALRGCIEQRANPAADAEIRVLFNRIYEEAFNIVPEYFDDYEKVPCPDGVGYGLVTKYKKI
jgi:thymidylate synthase (FAD)